MRPNTSFSLFLGLVTFLTVFLGEAHGQSFGANSDLAQGQVFISTFSKTGDRKKAFAEIPRALDNRTLLPPIKNQASCGSCTVFAATALLEAAIQREYGIPLGPLDPGIPVLMEQFTIDCAFPLNGCRVGWTMPQALASLVEFGATRWPELAGPGHRPRFAVQANYVPQRAQCESYLSFLRSDSTSFRFRPFEYQKFASPSLDGLKAAIKDYGAVATTLYWAQPSATGGVIRFSTTGCTPETCGGHAVLVVGYDDARRAFLIRNSWGPGAPFSENGYQWISYDEYSPISTSQFGFRDRGFYIFQRRPELPTQFSPVLADPRPRISVVVKGTGAGLVEAIRGSTMSCAPSCVSNVTSGTEVVLRARANPGSEFSGWQGCRSSVSNQCTTKVDQDTSVTAAFSLTRNGSENDAGLINVLGSDAEKLNNATAIFGSNKGIIIPRGVTKYDTLTLEDDEIVFDPTFVVDDGRYNAARNTSASALVVKYLQIPRIRVPATGALQITVRRPTASSGPALTGNSGATGSRGGDGAARGQCGGAGGNGGPGGNGTAGTSGKSRQYDRVVAISIGSIIDNLGRVIPPEKVRFRFEFGGFDGGVGGNGGAGGVGGNGGRGGDGRMNSFLGVPTDCACGPGGGGTGGNGGLGGDGGSGGDAGIGANLYVFLPQDFLSSISSINVSSGASGRRGFAGVSGVGGSGAARGSSPGICNAGGLKNVSDSGVSPPNIVSAARDGTTGGNGQWTPATFSSAIEHSQQLASAGIANDMLKDQTRLADVKLIEMKDDFATISWIDLNPSLGPLSIRLKQESSVLTAELISGSTGGSTLRVPRPGLYSVELIGTFNGSSQTLAQLPLFFPARGAASAKGISVWSSSGSRNSDTILAKFSGPLASSRDRVDLFVLAIVPSSTGGDFYFLDAQKNWVLVKNFVNVPSHRTNVIASEVGLIRIADATDLGSSALTGTKIYVGYGRRIPGGPDPFTTLLNEATYSDPLELR